ncbi:MAG TPA: hypothetical protein VMG14_05020 [Thermoplasmata archaeon]|jgi:hypothetical protein|nr:hypothetical protein [Thermoplasmata archaeon]
MDTSERGIGHLFALLGGGLIALGGVVAAVIGIGNALLGRFAGATGALTDAVLLLVVGGLVLLFGHLAEHDWKERSVATGVILVVLAAVGWGILGFGGSVLALVGALFAFLAGVLYLIEPTRRATHALVASS